MGRVPQQEAPLLERLHDQRDVALLEIADPPWTSFVERLKVPLPKSPCSSNTTS